MTILHNLIDELKADLRTTVYFSEDTWKRIEDFFEGKKAALPADAAPAADAAEEDPAAPAQTDPAPEAGSTAPQSGNDPAA